MTLPDQTSRPPWWERIGYRPTSLEMTQWLARTSDANRDAWFENQRQNASQAHICWTCDHERQIDYLRDSLAAASRRIVWLESNYAAAPPVPDPPEEHPCS